MNSTEKRNLIVSKALTRKEKNTYSQDSNKRTKIESGYGDCSGTVWYWYNKLFGINIGGNTEAQINSTKGKTIALTITNGIPDTSVMKKGDLMFFRGNDSSRTKGVGHVEMYIGDGKCFGHGSGIGGTVKTVSSYCRTRYNTASTSKTLKNKGLICVRRFIPDDDSDKISVKNDIIELTDINDIVWEFGHRNIITNKTLWENYCKRDNNIYWLLRKTLQYIRTHENHLNALKELTDINDIVWEFGHRNIITDKSLWLRIANNNGDVYWILRKSLQYLRTHE